MEKKEKTQNRRSLPWHTSSKGSPSGREDGFTLIEVMIAIFVLTIGLLAVGTMQVSAVNGCTSARTQAEAVSLGQAISDEVLARSDDSDYLRAGTHPMADDPMVADPTDMPPFTAAQEKGYAVAWEVAGNTPTTGLTSVTVTMSWQSRGITRRVVLMSVKQ